MDAWRDIRLKARECHRQGRCHVVESLMRVRRVSLLKSCGGGDFTPDNLVTDDL